MIDEARVGDQLAVATFPVDRSKLAELGRALFDPDPVWHDPEAARAAGFDGVPTPPTVTVLADHWIPGGTIGPALALGADLPRLLHGEVAWELLVPVRMGDELTARVSVAGVTRREGKRGGTMTLVGLRTTCTRADGVLVARKHETFIETAEPPSGPSGGSRVRGIAGAPISRTRDAAGRPVTAAPVALAPGDELPREVLSPLTRTDVVRYAGAGGDLNPIHHDEPLAQAGGFPSVFAMGQLGAGVLGIRLARWVGPDQVRAFSCRFTGQVWPGDELVLTGRVDAIEAGVAALTLQVERTPGDVVVKATARAAVARPELPPLAQVEAAVRASWARDTSDDPELWSEENRALGQCAVSALVVRAIYGGELLIATVLDREGKRTPDGHAWNVLPDGTVVDWAFEQFRDGEQLDVGLVTEPVIHPDPRRAHLMAARVSERLGGLPIALPEVR